MHVAYIIVAALSDKLHELVSFDHDIRTVIQSLVLESKVLHVVLVLNTSVLKVAVVMIHVHILAAGLPQVHKIVLQALGRIGNTNALFSHRLHCTIHHINVDLTFNGADLGGLLHENRFSAYSLYHRASQTLSSRACVHMLLAASGVVLNRHSATLHAMRELGLRGRD